MAEGSDGLRVSVFVNGESGAVEIGDDVLAVVNDGGVKDDFFDLLAEDKDPTVAGIGSLRIARSLLRTGRWRLT